MIVCPVCNVEQQRNEALFCDNCGQDLRTVEPTGQDSRVVIVQINKALPHLHKYLILLDESAIWTSYPTSATVFDDLEVAPSLPTETVFHSYMYEYYYRIG